MAVIALEEMEFYAYHGFYPEENKIGGYYLVDVYLETPAEIATKKDELSGTINYETVYSICKTEMQVISKLIEHVAQRIFDNIHQKYASLQSLKVRVSKLNPPLGGKLARTFIEIEKKF